MLTGEESLKIIAEMINKTKVNIRKSSFHLLFWGWLIFFCSLSEYLLLHFSHISSPWTVWILTIPGVFVSMIYGFVNGRKERVHTYAGIIYKWTWIGFLATAISLYIIMSNNMQNFSQHILLLAGLATFISGSILKFRPLIIGGGVFWVAGIIAYFAGPENAQLVNAVAMLAGYLIPGYLLRRKAAHDKV